MQALEEIRLNMAELTKENVDLVILANMQQNRVNAGQTKQTATHKEDKERQRASVKFFSFRQTNLPFHLPIRPWSWFKKIQEFVQTL